MAEREVMKSVIDKIEAEIKKQKIQKQFIAKKLGYRRTSGLTNALKSNSLRVDQLMIIAEILNMRPAAFFPTDIADDFVSLPLIDLIKAVCNQEISRQVIEKYFKK